MAKKGAKKMNIERFVIAGGNTTALIKDDGGLNRINIAQDLINNDLAEQVGFTVVKDGIPTLEMMGGELCVNGTLAFAKSLNSGKGILRASGIEGDVSYEILSGGIVQAEFNLPYSRPKEDIVLFEDIGYKVGDSLVPGSTLWALARLYNKPAFGLTRMDRSGRINPLVYVSAVGTCVLETACGSGSMVESIVTGSNAIEQPTGEIIRVYRNEERFTVSAEVRKIKTKNGNN